MKDESTVEWTIRDDRLLPCPKGHAAEIRLRRPEQLDPGISTLWVGRGECSRCRWTGPVVNGGNEANARLEAVRAWNELVIQTSRT